MQRTRSAIVNKCRNIRLRNNALSLALCVFFSTGISRADNPIVQTLYTADPAPMVYNDKVYLYTSHDEDVIENNFFTMKNYRCYSSSDIVNWTDHGMVATIQDFKWAGTIGAWAPHGIHRDGKFYLYCPIQLKGIGVLVSNTPYGPFTDPLGRPLIKHSSGDIDPTVYIDSDGQAYLYWGNPDLYYVKLNQDMTSYSGNVTKVTLTVASFGKRSKTDRPTSYEEGPWLYKRNNLYYMVFAGGPVSEHIGYSTSNSPVGPWTYGGVIMPTQGASFTNHPGVIDFKGNSYFFYHNGALTGGGGYHRSVCVEQFSYSTDGKIPTINMTKNGPNQVGTLNPYDTVQAETICWESGVKTEKCSEGGVDVCNIENGDYIKVKGVNFGTGATTFDARVSSANSGGKIELRLDSQTGTLVGTCTVTGTGGWQTWATKSCTVTGATGTHDLFLKFTGGSGSLFNFNWWKFNQPVKTSHSVFRNTITTAKAVVDKESVQLSFPNQIVHENVNVSLFDLNGRIALTLYKGKLQQNQLIIPLRRNEIQIGTYILNVSTKKQSLLEKQVVIKN